MKEFEIIEAFKAMWDATTKNVVILESRAEKRFRLLFELRGLQVCVVLTIGQRLGVREDLFVLDPSQSIELDQLIVAELSKEGDGLLISRKMLRSHLQEGMDPVQAGMAALDEVLELAQNHSDVAYAEIMKARDDSGHSLATVSGGLPSLGKRH